MGGHDLITFLDSVLGAAHYSRDPGSPPGHVNPATTGVVSPPDSGANWRAVTDKLLDARNLADDWDGQGAAAPPRAAVDLTLTLALSLKSRGWPAPTDFGPTVDGGVTLTWLSGKQSVVIEITSALQIEGHRWIEGDARAVRFFA